MSERQRSRVYGSYFATDFGENAGRISRRAQRCSGGSLLIGGALIPSAAVPTA